MPPSPRDLRARLTRHADLVLAAMVVGAVAMMIVPLPPFLLDLLISLNLAVAVTLLLIAIYVSDALKIATFPTLLLLTTLFRLALEVSATRLILLRADAGTVIHAFGSFVVSGNLIVGAVIFLILTLIQFIVISKGAERVAEVAARFTLDAMPGKQLSIDAELRAGHIDAAEARRRRAALARESQLFGAMDGAMKFVKGDAVAGIVVLAVSIIGGLAIGVLQRGMDLSHALRTYALLTIGEGLVAQIPALVISIGAGVVVTRVASEDEGGHLGRDIGREVLAHPRALAVAAGLLGLLALTPGLPAPPFLLLAAVLGLLAWRLLATARATPIDVAESGSEASSRRDGGGALPAPRRTPVEITLAPDLAAELEVSAGGGGRFAEQAIAGARARLFAETGLALPPVQIRVAGAADSLPARGYRIALNEIPLLRAAVAAGAPAASQITDQLLALLRRRGHELVGIQETQALLVALERSHPALVREVVPRLVSPALLADVLRRLAAEGVSLRQLPEILGALAEAAPATRDAAALAERARAALRRAITFAHAGEAGVLAAIALDPLVEDTLRDAIRGGDGAGGGGNDSHLALAPEASRDILAGVGRALSAAPAGGPRPVIVTAVDLRRHVRRLIEVEHPDLAVLSWAELAPETRVDAFASVSV
ncbi:MAG TPA: flagellar biosynthesis protein FlhA [Polyangia bacterium]|nr:flagellar biosynthesis protein FlhA [Polyangia bacterium]